MSRAAKRFKEYERWVLIALVVILLATFSVTGAVRGCSRSPREHEDLGGSYQQAPGRRVDVTDADFRAVYSRYANIYTTEGWGPSLRYGSELAMLDRRARQGLEAATWQHIATVGAAEAAGYRVGDAELEDAVKEMVVRVLPRSPGVDPRAQLSRFSPEMYDQVVQRIYRGTKGDFETTVREILLKDKYLAPLVEAQRLATDRKDAYDAWKASQERVDLQFAAVPATAFEEAVALEEATRSAIVAPTARLRSLVGSALEVRRVLDAARTWKARNGDVWPADAAELTGKEPGKASLRGKMPQDGWGKPVVYERTADGARVYSAGPDGQAGTDDDVGAAVADAMTSLGALRRVGDALLSWRRATGAWPATLSDLTTAPPQPQGKPSLPAPLTEVPQDAWGRPLAWDAAAPSLASSGADGAPGTPDDLVAQVRPESVRVPAPALVAGYAGETGKDAWGRDLSVVVLSANPPAVGVASAGADGTEGTADDVTTGNDRDLQAYYSDVRIDFQLPLRREIEVLYVIPALVPDETFAEAWKRFPEHRPEEKEAWDLFRGTAFYAYEEGQGKDRVTIDAGDPKKGYAAAVLEDLRAKGSIPGDAKGWQVPAPEDFGDRRDPPPATPGGLPSAATDPLFRTYVEKGWRRVILRDLFFEKMLSAVLKSSREGAAAVKEWEKKGSKGDKPAFEGFAARLAAWKDLQPGEADAARGARFVQYYATKPGVPASREDLEQLPDIGDYTLSTAFGSLQDDDYPTIPTILRGGALRAALHHVKRHDPREPDLAEVREKVWPRYLAHRAMERAAQTLEALRDDLEKAWSAAGDAATPETRVADFARTATEAASRGKHPAWVARTGLFVGAAGLATRPPELVGTDEEKAAARRRAYVKGFGYDQVKGLPEPQGRPEVAVGQLGRKVLRDTRTGGDSTGCAYLVQVAAHAYPSPEEFHGGEYLRLVAEKAYDLPEWYPMQERPKGRSGEMIRVLYRAYDDWTSARRDFGIETHHAVETPKAAVGS